MKKYLLASLTMIFASKFHSVIAQNIGIGTNTPKAALEVASTTNGFLPPRMSFAQRNAIPNPAQGLIIYCTDCDSSGQAQIFNGTKWTNLIGGPAIGSLVANLPTVTIGTQNWSRVNLNVSKYMNGDPIPQVTNATEWATLTTGAWCWYNNDSATYAAYGKQYNWYAVNDPRGLAPYGWHIPTESDWNILVKFIEPSADTTCQSCSQGSTVGGALKSTEIWSSPNIGATNSSGFSGLPGGFRMSNGNFASFGTGGFWWSSSEFDAINAWYRGLYNQNSIIDKMYDTKKSSCNVRVIRNQ